MSILLISDKLEKEKIDGLNLDYLLVEITNEKLKKIIELKELLDFFKLDTKDLLYKILSFKKENNAIILLHNDKLLTYFQRTYNNVNFITNIDQFLYLKLNENKEEYKICDINKEEENINENSLFSEILNIKLDKIYCITLKNRVDRQNSIKQQCSKYNFSVEFLKEDLHNDPVEGCKNSHIKCIKDAKSKGYKNILILEDDSIISDHILNYYKENPIKIPDDYDIFYLGYNGNEGYRYKKNITKILSAQTTHSYILSHRVYDEVLNNINKDWNEFKEWNIRNEEENKQDFSKKAIDLFYAKIINHRRGKSYGLFPILCFQLEDHSDIENKKISYNSLFMEKSYKLYCKTKQEMDIFVINLKRRPERLKKLKENYFHELPYFKIFTAIDGETFNFEKALPLFDLKDFNKNKKNPYPSHEWRTGVLGCSLSHLLLWENILTNTNKKDNDFNLILEDDITLSNNFVEKLNNLLDELVNDNAWDIVYLGFTDYKNTGDISISKHFIQFSGNRRLHGGGTFGYIIRKRGAKKLHKLAMERKIQQAIDWFMIEQFDKIIAYKTKEDLIFSEVNKDSDIQNNFRTLDFNKNKNNKLESIKEEPIDIDKDLDELQKLEEIDEKEKEKNCNYNNYKEIIINDKIFFKKANELFFINNSNEMEYYGTYNNGKLICLSKSKTHFSIDLNIDKEYILFYITKLNYHIRKLIEEYSKNNNVFVVSKYVYNVNINGIDYIYMKTDNILNELFKHLKIKEIYIDNFDFFLYTNTNIKINYLHNKLNNYNEYKNTQYDNYSITKNYLNHIYKLIFFSKDEAELFQSYYNIKCSNIEYKKLPLNNNLVLDNKKDYILSYDLHNEEIILFFKLINKTMNNKYKLIIFNDNKDITAEKNVLVKKRSYHLLQKYLQESKIFISLENREYTFYNILLANQSKCLSIIPKYYSEFKDKNEYILYSKLDSSLMNEIKQKFNN
jgi:GR25 family glycosyltransferase involved in LPS biosynthesis